MSLLKTDFSDVVFMSLDDDDSGGSFAEGLSDFDIGKVNCFKESDKTKILEIVDANEGGRKSVSSAIRNQVLDALGLEYIPQRLRMHRGAIKPPIEGGRKSEVTLRRSVVEDMVAVTDQRVSRRLVANAIVAIFLLVFAVLLMRHHGFFR